MWVIGIVSAISALVLVLAIVLLRRPQASLSIEAIEEELDAEFLSEDFSGRHTQVLRRRLLGVAVSLVAESFPPPRVMYFFLSFLTIYVSQSIASVFRPIGSRDLRRLIKVVRAVG